jgi:hypothetical protein
MDIRGVRAFVGMIYDYLRIANDRKGVDVHIFGEEKALIQSVSFGLIIGCNL